MDELRKNNAVEFDFQGTLIKGTVFDYVHDRVMVKIDADSVKPARKIRELDELFLKVNTKMGLKTMSSCVISKLNISNCIVVENTPSHAVEQKREYVRVMADFEFLINKNNKTTKHRCINISAGGIAFCLDSDKFEIGDIVNIVLPAKEFHKEIEAGAKIIKIKGNEAAMQFIEINKHDEDKILKFVFKLISEK